MVILGHQIKQIYQILLKLMCFLLCVPLCHLESLAVDISDVLIYVHVCLPQLTSVGAGPMGLAFALALGFLRLVHLQEVGCQSFSVLGSPFLGKLEHRMFKPAARLPSASVVTLFTSRGSLQSLDRKSVV